MQQNLIHNAEQDQQDVPEQRLWRAVITSTVQEWVSGTLTKSRAAEQFLFNDSQDYKTVCFSAGIDPKTLRNRLERIRITKTTQLLEDVSRN